MNRPIDAALSELDYFVGRVQHQRFRPGLVQGAPYGRWGELGPQRDKVFHLRHTTSPSAHAGKMASDQPGLYCYRKDAHTCTPFSSCPEPSC